MRNPIDVLNSLNKQSKNPTYKFQRLYRNLYNPEFYLLAYRNIYVNEGSMTPGVDGETLDGMSSPRIERIINSLKDGSYHTNPARRTYIAKKNSNKKRPLGIPSGDDKLVQEIVRMILESIYEPTFSDKSHGFRPKRSCHTALMQLQRTFAGANWFVEGDIQACFDSFDHQVLINILRRRIDDEAFISLMWKFLKAGYMEQWQYHRTYCGTPQGSGISPILANIYLHELDMHLEEYKSSFIKGDRFSRKANPEYVIRNREVQNYMRSNNKIWNTLSESEKKERAGVLRRLREKQRELPSKLYKDESYKNMQFVRYADDFIVGIVGSKADAEALKADLAVFLKEKLGLTLSDSKTKITHTTNRARFLGYDISISKSQEITKRQGRKVKGYVGAVKLYMPHEKWESKLREYGAIRIKKDKVTQKEHWKAIHRPKLLNRTDIDILSKYNSEIRGLYNYYSLACNVCAMSKFASLMHYSMLKTFANKYRTTANKIKQKYCKDGRFTVVYRTKSGTKESVFYRGPFVRKDCPSVKQADVLPSYKKYDKPNRLAAKLRSKTCELCGQYTNDIEIHQVKRLKSLNGVNEWERLMLKNHRKTLAVCPACHREIHGERLIC
ncbi:MAG: group II intron reverse transcriptase/maturase [Bacteroidaceae bacterium]|nr:group II intron reverse transcriptase/maturase [Bacteroidaceae bacterium]